MAHEGSLLVGNEQTEAASSAGAICRPSATIRTPTLGWPSCSTALRRQACSGNRIC